MTTYDDHTRRLAAFLSQVSQAAITTGVLSAVGEAASDVAAAIAAALAALTPASIGAEPALGNPPVDGYVLSSTTAGVRSWAEGGGGGGNYTLLDSVVLSNTAADITFSGISGGYKALEIHLNVRTDRAGHSYDNLGMRFNSDASAHYDEQIWQLTGTGASAFANAGQSNITIGYTTGADATSGFFAQAKVVILGYAATTFERAAQGTSIMKVSNVNNTFTRVECAGWWRNTADAISAIKFISGTGNNFIAGSRAYLYGIS